MPHSATPKRFAEGIGALPCFVPQELDGKLVKAGGTSMAEKDLYP